jgi:hypothetical protein
VDVAALVISDLALLTAGAAAFYTRSQSLATVRQAKAAESALAIEKERRADEGVARERAEQALRDAVEAKKASRVYVSTGSADGEWALHVHNDGPATARAVRVTIGPAVDGEALPYPLEGKSSPTEVGELHPDLPFAIHLGAVRAASARFKVTMDWTDDRGRQTRTQTVAW